VSDTLTRCRTTTKGGPSYSDEFNTCVLRLSRRMIRAVVVTDYDNIGDHRTATFLNICQRPAYWQVTGKLRSDDLARRTPKLQLLRLDPRIRLRLRSMSLPT
jgi:hypothetical protein